MLLSEHQNVRKQASLAECVSEKKLKSVNISQSYKQECGCIVYFVRLASALLKGEESARDNHVFALIFPNIQIFFRVCLV